MSTARKSEHAYTLLHIHPDYIKMMKLAVLALRQLSVYVCVCVCVWNVLTLPHTWSADDVHKRLASQDDFTEVTRVHTSPQPFKRMHTL